MLLDKNLKACSYVKKEDLVANDYKKNYALVKKIGQGSYGYF